MSRLRVEGMGTGLESKAEQIGGTHYASGYTHWDWAADLGLDYLRGAATKYLVRWQKKGGAEDLRKAATYCRKLLEHWCAPVDPDGKVGDRARHRWATDAARIAREPAPDRYSELTLRLIAANPQWRRESLVIWWVAHGSHHEVRAAAAMLDDMADEAEIVIPVVLDQLVAHVGLEDANSFVPRPVSVYDDDVEEPEPKPLGGPR